jgi:hypothetical protein
MTAKIRKPRGGAKWPQAVTYGSASVKVYEVEHETNASAEKRFHSAGRAVGD